MTDSLTLARLGARAGGQLWRDRQHVLPLEVDQACTPSVLEGLLRDYPIAPWASAPRVSAVSVRDTPSISSNCDNRIVDVTWASGDTMPGSLFVKWPMERLATRWFFGIINAWELESHFFRHVAGHLPLRTPRAYATHHAGTRFFLVQENLADDPAVTLFTNPDMMKGPSLELARRCLDGFAQLHAAHVHLTPAQQENLLPRRLHLFLSKDMGTVSRTLNRMALAPCQRKRPGQIPAAVAQAYGQTLEHWDALLAHWHSGPLSLLHGDSHLGNWFVDGDAMGMLDWQAAHWGKGVRDVQYFLINSLPVGVLADNEQALLAWYLKRREVYGAPLDAEQAWDDYRSLSFHTLMTIVVSIGFGALNEEQDRLMANILDRAVAASLRVDYPGWLAQFLAQR